LDSSINGQSAISQQRALVACTAWFPTDAHLLSSVLCLDTTSWSMCEAHLINFPRESRVSLTDSATTQISNLWPRSSLTPTTPLPDSRRWILHPPTHEAAPPPPPSSPKYDLPRLPRPRAKTTTRHLPTRTPPTATHTQHAADPQIPRQPPPPPATATRPPEQTRTPQTPCGAASPPAPQAPPRSAATSLSCADRKRPCGATAPSTKTRASWPCRKPPACAPSWKSTAKAGPARAEAWEVGVWAWGARSDTTARPRRSAIPPRAWWVEGCRCAWARARSATKAATTRTLIVPSINSGRGRGAGAARSRVIGALAGRGCRGGSVRVARRRADTAVVRKMRSLNFPKRRCRGPISGAPPPEARMITSPSLRLPDGRPSVAAVVRANDSLATWVDWLCRAWLRAGPMRARRRMSCGGGGVWMIGRWRWMRSGCSSRIRIWVIKGGGVIWGRRIGNCREDGLVELWQYGSWGLLG